MIAEYLQMTRRLNDEEMTMIRSYWKAAQPSQGTLNSESIIHFPSWDVHESV